MSRKLKRIARTFEDQAGAQHYSDIPLTNKQLYPPRDLMVEVKVPAVNPSKMSTALGLILAVEKLPKI